MTVGTRSPTLSKLLKSTPACRAGIHCHHLSWHVLKERLSQFQGSAEDPPCQGDLSLTGPEHWAIQGLDSCSALRVCWIEEVWREIGNKENPVLPSSRSLWCYNENFSGSIVCPSGLVTHKQLCPVGSMWTILSNHWHLLTEHQVLNRHARSAPEPVFRRAPSLRPAN